MLNFSSSLSSRTQGDHHPKGLRVLFFTEMWERFSYYGMRALLVVYLVNALGYAREDALRLYGIYTGLVYFTPLIGGVLADRYLGQRRAVVIGGILMLLGHIAMAFDSLLYEALGLLILGNGFFKPNVSVMIGGLYEDRNDPRRTGGYSIFYMGINLGGFLAPIVAGTIGETIGWHYGFACAAVGMALGLWQLFRGQSLLGRVGLKHHQSEVGVSDWRLLSVWVAAGVTTVLLIIHFWSGFSDWFGSQSTLVQVLLSVFLAASALRGLTRRTPTNDEPALTRLDGVRIACLIVVMLFVIVFWASFEQQGGSMNLFVDQNTDRQIGNFTIPAAWFQSINPLGILIMGPVFSWIWTHWDRSRWAVSEIFKQGLGMVVLGLGCLLMVQFDALAQTQTLVNPLWVAVVMLLFTMGEVMVAPVGLAMISRAAPVQMVSLLMGVALFANAVANYLAGTLEHYLKNTGWPLYEFLSVSTIGCGALLMLISPLLWRLMKLNQTSS